MKSPQSPPDFLRLASLAPELRVSDVSFNTAAIRAAMQAAVKTGAAIALFPELCVTGYTCGDLFAQASLRAQARAALLELAAATKSTGIHAVVGLPLAVHGRLYNCAAVLGSGRVLGLVPKQFLPTTGEYYEERWFTSAAGLAPLEVNLGDYVAPLSTNLLFTDEATDCTFGVELCEDLWAVHPPSGDLCLAGANLILNPSASNELIGKAAYRRDLVRQQSARCLTAYAYASAGPGESSTDVVFSGHWHGDELLLVSAFAGKKIAVMSSWSRDGTLMTLVLRWLGYKVSRGSSNKGGCAGLKGLVDAMKGGGAASLAVDGPRGPLHRVKPGVLKLAQLTGCPIVPVAGGYCTLPFSPRYSPGQAPGTLRAARAASQSHLGKPQRTAGNVSRFNLAMRPSRPEASATRMKQLAQIMVDADLELARREAAATVSK